MTFPNSQHPLYCPQSNGPGHRFSPADARTGCPRCGRLISHRRDMTLLPHLRFRWQDWEVRATAARIGLPFIVEPWGHRGRARDGYWIVVDTQSSQIVRHRIHHWQTGEPVTRDTFPTIQEAFALADDLNGWPVIDGLDLGEHLLLWHGRGFTNPPNTLAEGFHETYHEAYLQSHRHEGDLVIAVA